MPGLIEIIFISVLVIGIIACPFICAIIADQKGRSVGGWIAGGIFLGWVGVIIIACLSDQNQDYSQWRCPNCGEMISEYPCDNCNYSDEQDDETDE